MSLVWMTLLSLIAIVATASISYWLGRSRALRMLQEMKTVAEPLQSATRLALREVKLLQARQQALMDSIDDLAWLKDREGRFVLVNRKFEEVFGISRADIIGQHDFDLLPPDVAQHYHDDDLAVMTSRSTKRIEEKVHMPNGDIGWTETVKVPVFDEEGGVIGTAGIARDVTSRKRLEEQAAFLANHDPLTGLANRRQLEEHFDNFLMWYPHLAAIFLDLDNFKLINDTDGHSVGDTLLRMLAKRLMEEVSEHELLVRLGGDEFLILAPVPNGDINHIEDLAKRLGVAVGTPFDIANAQYAVSSSIGIALCPEHGKDRQTLIKHADIAMYEAKRTGRNRVCWFDPGMASEAVNRRKLEMVLRRALEQHTFQLHYQPVIDVATRRIVGAEALLRLRDPQEGLVSPAMFVPVAEESGLILPIGDWVLQHCFQQMRHWLNQGATDFKLSINISGAQFAQHDFADKVAAWLAEYGIPGAALEFEVTEGVLMADVETHIATLERIHQLGIELAVDDFGTGYSSLAYLKRLPIHRLKIDRTFVSGLPDHQGDVAITQSILSLASAFNLRVTAEGVEMQHQFEFLRNAGCELVQGYLFSPPKPLADFEQLLVKNGH
ncbi:EAL domain-containing protein [Chitinivorax sp. B]|uniref:putative bifunctional diguanylate cyclase/phosphodiesterase n=1 Tax=Chitinivorax sp. B TaxID=2502235 RepID=UPI0010F8A753|nr:EAL domain-containing protein [Chitinivorax sp. B]